MRKNQQFAPEKEEPMAKNAESEHAELTADASEPGKVEEARRVKRETHDLAVPLTIHEKVDMGATLVTLFGEKQAVEESLSESKLAAKDELTRIENKIAATVDTLRAGSVKRPVEVEVVMDYQQRIVTYARLDTGEEYSSRPMSYDEVQTALHLAP